MKGMNRSHPHTKAKHRETSFRDVVNALETSQQQSEPAVLPVRDNSRALPTQLAGGLSHEAEQRRDDVTEHERESRRQFEHRRVSRSAAEGEVCSSSTDQPPAAAAAFVSLQNYSDYVVMVPTPRTSSPIPDRSPTSAQLQTDVSANLESLEQANVRQVDDDGVNRKVTVGAGSSDVARNRRGGSQLQKTVGRLKRYFGLAAACGTSSESRQDDVSLASREATSRPLPATDREQTETVDDDVARRRTLSVDSHSPDTAAAVVGSHRALPPELGEMRRIRRRPEKYPVVLRGQLTGRQRRDPVPSAARVWKSVHGAAKDDLALETAVPGVRVRVPPRRQLSQHERPMTDSSHVVGTTTQAGSSWLQEDAHARSRANVERWLSQNSDADRGRSDSLMMSRQQQHRHSMQRTNHASRSHPRDPEAPDRSTMERSVSETDVRRSPATDRFRSRDQHRTTPNRSSVPRTPPSMAGSTGAEAESRLGPSLVQLVAEIIEGLEQRSRDDSSAVWSGIRANGTPASRVFQQLTTRVRGTDAVATGSRGTVEDRRRSADTPTDGQTRGSAESQAKTSITRQDKTRDDPTCEAPSEKTLTVRRGNLATAATTTQSTERRSSSSAVVPSCSVAVLRQRLLRAVEGNAASRRPPVTDPERPPQRRSTEGTQTETDTGNFQSSALISCTTGIVHLSPL